MTRCDDGAVADPGAVEEGEEFGAELHDGVLTSGIGDVYGRVMGDPADFVAIWGEADAVHPAAT